MTVYSKAKDSSTNLCVDCYPSYNEAMVIYHGNSLCCRHLEERKHKESTSIPAVDPNAIHYVNSFGC